MTDDVDVYANLSTQEVISRIIELEAEVAHLRNQEALKNIALGDIKELHEALNAERIRVAQLRDAIDGMSTDMSFMEDRISELSGRHEITPDYPDNE
jgi:phage shock protein A